MSPVKMRSEAMVLDLATTVRTSAVAGVALAAPRRRPGRARRPGCRQERGQGRGQQLSTEREPEHRGARLDAAETIAQPIIASSSLDGPYRRPSISAIYRPSRRFLSHEPSFGSGVFLGEQPPGTRPTGSNGRLRPTSACRIVDEQGAHTPARTDR